MNLYKCTFVIFYSSYICLFFLQANHIQNFAKTRFRDNIKHVGLVNCSILYVCSRQWKKGQPDNGGYGEHCGEFWNRELNDDSCDNQRNYICEKDKCKPVVEIKRIFFRKTRPLHRNVPIEKKAVSLAMWRSTPNKQLLRYCWVASVKWCTRKRRAAPLTCLNVFYFQFTITQCQ